MNRKLEVLKIKQARGRLLVNLNLFYPHAVLVRTLYRTVCDEPSYNKALLLKDLTYFHDKGYISWCEDVLRDSPEFEERLVKLTATGKEVAEGTITDDALEI